MADPTPPTPAPGNPPPGTPPTPAPGPGNTPGNPPAPPTKPISEMSFEELAAANPHAKGFLRDLQDERSKRQDLEKAEADRRNQDLTAQGKFKELAEAKEKEANDFKLKYETEAKRNAFNAAAMKAGIQDLDAAWKLAEHGKITLDAAGAVQGAEDCATALAKDKPYLVGKPGAVGSPSAPPTDPADPGNKRIYKRSELRDNSFFEKNKEDIMRATKENRIIDG